GAARGSRPGTTPPLGGCLRPCRGTLCDVRRAQRHRDSQGRGVALTASSSGRSEIWRALIKPEEIIQDRADEAFVLARGAKQLPSAARGLRMIPGLPARLLVVAFAGHFPTRRYSLTSTMRMSTRLELRGGPSRPQVQECSRRRAQERNCH